MWVTDPVFQARDVLDPRRGSVGRQATEVESSEVFRPGGHWLFPQRGQEREAGHSGRRRLQGVLQETTSASQHHRHAQGRIRRTGHESTSGRHCHKQSWKRVGLNIKARARSMLLKLLIDGK